MKKYAKIVILLLFLALRLTCLGKDISNSDAARWHRRSERFLTAIKTGNIKDTYQHYQPGITIMWLNSFVKQAAFTYQYNFLDEVKTLENADYYPIIHGVSKATLVFVLGVLLFAQIQLIEKLYGQKTALFYGFFMALEPYVVGIDRWFHLTSLETYFVFTSFLLLLLWREENDLGKKRKLLVFSGVLFALSVLSKLTSLIPAPLFLYFLVTEYTKDKNFKIFIIFFISSFFTFIVLFPALWVDPFEILTKLIGAVFGAVSDEVRLTELPKDLYYVYIPFVLAFKLSPLLLFLGAFSILKTRLKPVLLYLFFYFLVFTFADKKIDRYCLVFIPPLILLVSDVVSKFSKKFQMVIVSLTILFSVFVINTYYPVFSAYYSPILGGTKSALTLGIYENSGEYFADAAFYLNEKGRAIVTCVPNNLEAFSYFYKGVLVRDCSVGVDYVVRSVDINRKTFEADENEDLVVSFGGDFPVVGVFEIKKVPTSSGL